jgi:hypothetical protein
MTEEKRGVGRPAKNFLASLTETQIRGEFASAAHERLLRAALHLGPALLRVPPGDALRSSDGASSCADLLAFAQTGAIGDWDPGDPCNDALDACRALWDCVYGSQPEDSQLSLDAPLGCLLLAVYARCDIAAGGELPTKRLAALAGVTLNTPRDLVSRGELAAEKRGRELYFAASEARRWLSGRGVKGV